MITNLGASERLLRVLIGLGLLAIALAWGETPGWIGVAFVATGALGNDPIYQVLGVTSARGRRGTAPT